MKDYGFQAKLIATGNVPATFTSVMSGQVDIGFSTPPFGLDALAEGTSRLIALANDLPSVRNQTVRLIIANATDLAKRREVYDRFIKAYREAIDWMYSDPRAIEAFAKYAVDLARDGADACATSSIRRSMLQLDEVKGMPELMQDAIAFKYIPAVLTPAQLDELLQLRSDGLRRTVVSADDASSAVGAARGFTRRCEARAASETATSRRSGGAAPAPYSHYGTARRCRLSSSYSACAHAAGQLAARLRGSIILAAHCLPREFGVPSEHCENTVDVLLDPSMRSLSYRNRASRMRCRHPVVHRVFKHVFRRSGMSFSLTTYCLDEKFSRGLQNRRSAVAEADR